MPRLIHDARNVRLVRGIPQDESIPPAVFQQPFLHVSVLLIGVQQLIADVHNVHRQPQLMLAGARHRHLAPGFGLGVLQAVSLVHPFRYLIIIKRFLEILCPIGGADHRRQPCVVAPVDHFHQRVIAALVDLQPVGQGHQVHRPVLRHLVPGVYQGQKLRDRLRSRLRLLRLFLGNRRGRRFGGQHLGLFPQLHDQHHGQDQHGTQRRDQQPPPAAPSSCQPPGRLFFGGIHENILLFSSAAWGDMFRFREALPAPGQRPAGPGDTSYRTTGPPNAARTRTAVPFSADRPPCWAAGTPP